VGYTFVADIMGLSSFI